MENDRQMLRVTSIHLMIWHSVHSTQFTTPRIQMPFRWNKYSITRIFMNCTVVGSWLWCNSFKEFSKILTIIWVLGYFHNIFIGNDICCTVFSICIFLNQCRPSVRISHLFRNACAKIVSLLRRKLFQKIQCNGTEFVRVVIY